METSIIKIGNSKGLRLSKTILEKYNIKEKVELILEKDKLYFDQFKNLEKTGKSSSKK